MSLTLYSTNVQHSLAQSVNAVANLAGIAIENVYPTDEVKESKEFKAKKAHGKFPMLETPEGDILFESIAIGTYLARRAGATKLLGETPFAEAQVEQWNQIAATGFTGLIQVYYGTCGHIPATGYGQKVKALKELIERIDASLAGKQYLTGDSITVADIFVWGRVTALFQLALDAAYRATVPNVAAWQQRIAVLPEVSKVFGIAKLCETPVYPQGYSGEVNKVLTWTEGHFFTMFVLATARIAGVQTETVIVSNEERQSAAFKKEKSPFLFPLLRTPDGTQIAESAAIATYFARIGDRPALLGGSQWEQAQVDQYLSLCQSSFSVDSYWIDLGVLGYPSPNYQKHLKSFKETARALNAKLEGIEFLVGNQLTLADLAMFGALMAPWGLVLDGGFRKAMPHLTAWYNRIAALPEIVAVYGNVRAAEKALVPPKSS